MNLTIRVSLIALTALAAALSGTAACSDNAVPPATESGTGGATTTTTTGSGGATSTDASGGATATASGGATVAASGGATAASGGATTTTTTAAGGAGACNYPTTSPPLPTGGAQCASTVVKGGACTTEAAVCYKPCGPTNSGWKTETCTGGVYVEVSSCVWTAADYSAFKVPAALTDMSTQCPAGVTPQASTACSIPSCIPCASTTGGYMDSGGAAKAGWCECVGYDAAAGTAGKWTCGGAGTAWPCPGQAGC